MRFEYSAADLSKLFEQIKLRSGKKWPRLAEEFGVSGRTLFCWRTGMTTIPQGAFDWAVGKYDLTLPRPAREIDESVERLIASKKGALARYRLYGNLGTAEGRKKGGQVSSSMNSYFNERQISIPVHSIELAEFVGIVLGDGGISSRQVVITLHKRDDKEYALYVKRLADKLFGISSSIRERNGVNVTEVVISSTSAVRFLSGIGLFVGSKVKRQARVPAWIRQDIQFSKACVRGLVDTDGCFYVDTHMIKGVPYSYPCLAFTNRSLPLLSFFKETLLASGYHPTQSTKWDVFLRRGTEIARYMEEIGTSNLKISARFDRFRR